MDLVLPWAQRRTLQPRAPCLHLTVCYNQYREWLYERNRKELESLQKVEVALEKMDNFSRTKKNMHLHIREGILEALKELKALRDDMKETDCYLNSFEYLLRGRMVERIKEI